MESDSYWTPGRVRYATRIAIGLAVEIETGLPHPPTNDCRDTIREYRNAARNLGADDPDRMQQLSELAGLLAMAGAEPIPTVERVLARDDILILNN